MATDGNPSSTTGADGTVGYNADNLDEFVTAVRSVANDLSEQAQESLTKLTAMLKQLHAAGASNSEIMPVLQPFVVSLKKALGKLNTGVNDVSQGLLAEAQHIIDYRNAADAVEDKGVKDLQNVDTPGQLA